MEKMKKITISSLLLSVMLLITQNAYCLPPKAPAGPNEPAKIEVPKDPNYVVAVFDGKELTLAEVNFFAQAADFDTIKNVADFWINTQLLYDDAIKNAIDKDAKTKFMADVAFKKTIATAYIESVQKNVNVTDAEVKEYYDKNKDTDPRLQEPAYISFSHITVDTNDQAMAIRQRLEKGEEINELAKTLSVASDAKKGGKCVKFREETVRMRYGEAFLNALNNATEGQIIGPVKDAEGKYEIVRHEGKRAAHVLDFDKVKDQIKSSLENDKKRTTVEKTINDLREKNKGEFKMTGVFAGQEKTGEKEKKSEK
jgi:parvulin-like peptidyl-prolyl isomerase